MTGTKNITQLCFSSSLAGILANKFEQNFHSVYSYSGIESIEHPLNEKVKYLNTGYIMHRQIYSYQYSQIQNGKNACHII